MKTPRAISRKDAKDAGLTRYFTGKTCSRGHIDEYLTSCAHCCTCHRLDNRKRDKENPERCRKKAKKWRLNNLELVKRIAVIKMSAWLKAHPDARRARDHKRRSKKLSAKGSHTRVDIRRIFDRQEGRCAALWCNAALIFGYHVDHKTPLSRGGSNWPQKSTTPLSTLAMIAKEIEL